MDMVAEASKNAKCLDKKSSNDFINEIGNNILDQKKSQNLFIN
jgi:hypothetical protein